MKEAILLTLININLLFSLFLIWILVEINKKPPTGGSSVDARDSEDKVSNEGIT